MTTKSCNVYVLRNKETKRLKIGISKDVERRKRQLQTGNDAEIEILYSRAFLHCRKAEMMLHQVFGAHRKRGEWFEISRQNLELLERIFTQTYKDEERSSLERLGLV